MEVVIPGEKSFYAEQPHLELSDRFMITAQKVADRILFFNNRHTELLKIAPSKTSETTVESQQVSGVFVAAGINWDTVATNLRTKGYSPFIEAPENVVNALGLKQVFPINRLRKEFSPYLETGVNVEPLSCSEEEARSYIPQLLKAKRVQVERGRPILDWLDERRGKNASEADKKLQPFYFVINFNVSCRLDLEKFLSASKANFVEMGNPDTITKFAINLLKIVAEQKVYPDFCACFDIQKTSPFVQYFEARSGLSLSILDQKDSIKLGQPFRRKVRIVNQMKKLVSVNRATIGKIDKTKELKTKKTKSRKFEIRSLKTDPFEIEVQDRTKTETIQDSVEFDLIFKPKKSLLRAGLMPQRSEVTVQLVDAILGIPIAEQTREFELEDPDLCVEVKAPVWSHKGAEIKLEFSGRLSESTYEKSQKVIIPIRVKMLGSDVDYIYPPASSDEGKNGTLVYLSNEKASTWLCLFKAKKAGALRAYFTFSYAKDSTMPKDWQAEILGKQINRPVFPSFWPDTTAFIVPIIFAFAHQAFPDIIPQLAATEVNVSTVTSFGAMAFLGYRFFNWARTSPNG